MNESRYQQASRTRAAGLPMTLAEIGKRLGISRERAAQLERSALAKLRRHPVIQRLAQEIGLPTAE